MRNYTIIVAIFLFASCGPASKLRRAEKLIKKAEQRGAVWSSDTVFVERTVFVPEIRVDSVTILKPGDSVTIFKDRLEVKIKRLAGDTVFVDAKCDTVTITERFPVTVTKEIVVHGRLRWYHLLMWCTIALIVGAVVGRFLRLVL